ncbi:MULTISPECIES: hypothetical protein [Clostridium]|nr:MULTISPECIES: hypothetical protein [Clostridium]MCR1950132.1 hypothetical protein [Clostridium sp. DSM 100503]MDI9215123.1 hypothetical protein [Clostridium tertium]
MGVKREVELQTITTRFLNLKNLGLDEETIIKLLEINEEDLEAVKLNLEK